jgi:OmcA/MtrC family decaheme c-type cytochrome
LFAVAMIAGCSGGKDGAAGPAGPTGPQGPGGSTGPSGPVLALDISVAKTVTPTITNVTAGDWPTISFKLVDENGNPLKGLKASTVSFALGQLKAPAAGSGWSSEWRNYVTRVVASGAPAADGWPQVPTVQGTTQRADVAGTTFVDNGDGTYSFKFSKSLSDFAAVSSNAGPTNANGTTAATGATGVPLAYDGTLTHRVGIELRGTGPATAAAPSGSNNGTGNSVYTYRPSDGMTVAAAAAAGTPLYTREVVSLKECDACHARLEMHGGARNDVQYCVLCHNGGSVDSGSGNVVDLRFMVHKIHAGKNLPSVKAWLATQPAGTLASAMPALPGKGFAIFGSGATAATFNDISFPQDIRNCTTCHNPADAGTPDAHNYADFAYTRTCGACHDTMDMVAHTNTAIGGGSALATVAEADATCMNAGCHASGTTGVAAVGGGTVDTVTAHAIVKQTMMAKYKLTIFRVEAVTPGATLASADVVETACAAKIAAAAASASVVCTVPPGYYPRVTIKVVDPTNNNAAYDLSQPPFSAYGSTISARAGWSTLNYTNPGAIVGAGAPQAEAVNFLANISASNNAGPAPITTATATSCPVACPGYSAYVTAATSGSAVSIIPQIPAAYLGNSNTTLTARFPYPVPLASDRALVGGSGAIGAQASLNFANVADVGTVAPKVSGSTSLFATAIPIRVADPVYFPITDTTAVARRQVVDFNNCLRCHKKLVLHGSRVDNVQFCVMCHNPAQSVQVPTRGAAGVPYQHGAEPVDFKYFIHGIHSANYKAGELDFTEVGFPGKLNNCLGCHKTGTYYPVDPAAVFGTTIDPGVPPSSTKLAGWDDPTNHYAITANAAACGSCHVDQIAQNHMKQQGATVIGDLISTGGTGVNGLGFGVPNTFVSGAPHIKAIDGSTLPQYQTESCGVCHGPGATADVKVVHDAASFKFN